MFFFLFTSLVHIFVFVLGKKGNNPVINVQFPPIIIISVPPEIEGKLVKETYCFITIHFLLLHIAGLFIIHFSRQERPFVHTKITIKLILQRKCTYRLYCVCFVYCRSMYAKGKVYNNFASFLPSNVSGR